MRPGPRLVVMALAFISGAQRGTSQQSSSRGKLGIDSYDNSLSRINPWLSACDLEQPNTAPDLQGQCSSDTLPVSWINEGPGPPRCPPSCQKYHVNDRYNQNINNNNKNNYNLMNNNNKISHNNKNNINNKINNDDDDDLNMENRLNENRQCLDYLGDNDELSPSQICKSSSDIETKLKSIRLRHCCERNVLSALHNTAKADVLKGGAGCINTLNDLIETDALAARITCEFTEILDRYDCGQTYSLIHHCEDCKEAYRRWVCSTFIPYFSTKSDIKLKPTTNKSSRQQQNLSDITANVDSKSTNSNLGNNIDNKAQKMFKQTQNLEGSNEIKRSRRKAKQDNEGKRIRIRPCLSVCQTVEQKCPYMLPADRAPAYPTQYAGEPTFLCLDPNIEEVGEQVFKSNNGPRDCCYEYCGSPADGLCSSTCDLVLNSNANLASINSTSLSVINSNTRGHDTDDWLLFHDHRNPSLSQNYFKSEDGLVLMNDNSDLPAQKNTCPPVPNTTIPSAPCNKAQPPTASMSSSASSVTLSLSFSSSISITLNILIKLTNSSKNYWTIFLLSLFKFAALKVLLQLAGS